MAFSPAMEMLRLQNFTDSCQNWFHRFIFVITVSFSCIFLEGTKIDLDFSKVSKAF